MLSIFELSLKTGYTVLLQIIIKMIISGEVFELKMDIIIFDSEIDSILNLFYVVVFL